jgi:hypothetical protein
MRLNRNTGFFLVGALVFIVLALFVLNNPTLAPNNTPTPENTTEKVFPNLDFDQVRTVMVADSANLSLTLTQEQDGSWTLSNNPNPVAQQATDTAVSNLVNIQSSNRFTDVTDLATYGLDAPRYTLTMNNGAQDFVLKIGNNNPSGTRTYALVNDDTATVYLLSNPATIATLTGYLTNAPVVVITPTAAPSLDRAGILFLEYDPNRIVKVQLVNNASNENMTLLKQEDGTFALDPFSTNYAAQPLDQQLSQILVQVFGGFEAVDVLTNVTDLAAVGLDAPQYTLTATRDDGFEYKINVGGTDPSGTRYYVQILDLPNVGVVSATDINSLLQFIGVPPFVMVEVTPEATSETTAEATEVP